VPLLDVTLITSMYVGNESTSKLLLVGPVPVFPTLIVNVKLSFTLACEGATVIVNDAFGVNVPVKVGEGVKVCVGDGPAVPVDVGDGNVPVIVALGLGVFVYVGPKSESAKIIGKYP